MATSSPGFAEQWRRFGALPPVRRWAARGALALTFAFLLSMIFAAAAVVCRVGAYCVVVLWRATAW